MFSIGILTLIFLVMRVISLITYKILFSLTEVDIKAPGEQTMDRSIEDEESSIVDMLLADVRSGFANRKFGDSSFSVTKVKKVNLDNNDNVTVGMRQTFVRGGHGRRSMRRKKIEEDINDNIDSESTCSSLEDANELASRGVGNKNDGLMDILMTDDTKNDDQNFERAGSLRRRRLEKREKKNTLDVFDRERAPSPNVEAVKANEIARARTPSAIEAQQGDEEDLPDKPLRRTRSMFVRRPKTPQQTENDENKDTSDDMVARIKRKLSQRNTPSPVPGPDGTPSRIRESSTSPVPDDSRARWRSGIAPTVDVNRNLQTIDEKQRLETPTRELEEQAQVPDTSSAGTPIERSREQMARRFSNRNTMDPEDLKKMLERVESSSNDSNPQGIDADGHKVSVSVKTQLNRKWKSDLGKNEIDQVLRAIEESEAKKDQAARIQSQATVQAQMSDGSSDMRSADEANNSGGESEALKAKRKIRKQRSNLSLDDVKQALHSIGKPAVVSPAEQTTTTVTAVVQQSPTAPELPPRRSRSNSENEDRKTPEKELKSKKDKKDTSNMSKAAKLAAKRRFRHERFGDKDRPIETNGTRWKSDVQKEEIDEALKDLKRRNESV